MRWLLRGLALPMFTAGALGEWAHKRTDPLGPLHNMVAHPLIGLGQVGDRLERLAAGPLDLSWEMPARYRVTMDPTGPLVAPAAQHLPVALVDEDDDWSSGYL